MRIETLLIERNSEKNCHLKAGKDDEEQKIEWFRLLDCWDFGYYLLSIASNQIATNEQTSQILEKPPQPQTIRAVHNASMKIAFEE